MLRGISLHALIKPVFESVNDAWTGANRFVYKTILALYFKTSFIYFKKIIELVFSYYQKLFGCKLESVL